MDLFAKFKSAPKSQAKVIADLDALISEPIAFKFGGRVHLIQPIQTSEFFVITNKLAKMDLLRAKSEISKEELLKAYEDVICSACKTIKPKDIASMTQTQLAAIFQLILDCLTGKAYIESEDEKKNSQMKKPKLTS